MCKKLHCLKSSQGVGGCVDAVSGVIGRPKLIWYFQWVIKYLARSLVVCCLSKKKKGTCVSLLFDVMYSGFSRAGVFFFLPCNSWLLQLEPVPKPSTSRRSQMVQRPHFTSSLSCCFFLRNNHTDCSRRRAARGWGRESVLFLRDAALLCGVTSHMGPQTLVVQGRTGC